MPDTTLPPILITETDAAKVLGISPRKLWQLRSDGQIPCIRMDRTIRYRVGALEEWARSQERKQEAKTEAAI
jgi:hypothetical protein